MTASEPSVGCSSPAFAHTFPFGGPFASCSRSFGKVGRRSSALRLPSLGSIPSLDMFEGKRKMVAF